MSSASLLQSSPAYLWAPARSGVATIANGQTSVDVADTRITADSVILLSPALNANAIAFQTVNDAGVKFTINTNANPAVPAGVAVRYFVLKY